ncbi:MAG: VOC family protein [Planctomycetota bacterium]|jgi:predicted enzyme related to lactoylglutathione lyase
MKRVTGIGGIFFRAQDPDATRNWYAAHLGLNIDPSYGTSFEWRHADDAAKKGYTAWSPFAQDTDYFGDSGQQYMVNYRVADLEALIETLRGEGVEIAKEIQTFGYGKFAHIVGPEGVRIELWEPNDEEYCKILDDKTTS